MGKTEGFNNCFANQEFIKCRDGFKIAALRMGLITCLITAAIITTIITEYKLSENEHELFQSQFDSTSQNALKTMVNSFQRMNIAVQEMSSTYSHIFPDKNTWPNAAWTGFQPNAKLLGEISGVPSMGILPIVYPHQVAKYEPFIANYYNGTDPYADAETFLSPYFPAGTIFSQDWSKVEPPFYIDHYGNSSNNRRQLMTPLSQYILSSLAVPNQVGYNMYSLFIYTDTIDSVMDCVESSTDITYKTTQCGTLSRPFIFTTPQVQDVVAKLVKPIFPANNSSELVGFVAGTISWTALLTNIIPVTVGSLYCVISTNFETYTFLIE